MVLYTECIDSGVYWVSELELETARYCGRIDFRCSCICRVKAQLRGESAVWNKSNGYAALLAVIKPTSK